MMMPDPIRIDPERWPALAWKFGLGDSDGLFYRAHERYGMNPRSCYFEQLRELDEHALTELAQLVAEREAAARRDAAVNPLHVTAASAPVGSLTTDDPPTVVHNYDPDIDLNCTHCGDEGWVWLHELPDTSDWDGSADDTQYPCPYCGHDDAWEDLR